MIIETKKSIKFIVTILLVAFMAIHCSTLKVQAAATSQEVTIYGLSSSYLEKISMPSNVAQGYQINVGDEQAVTYKIVEGESVKVSATGYITPAYTYWKRTDGYSYSVREGEEYDYYTLEAGESTVTATTGGITYTYNVCVKDYADEYCQQVMEKYIEDNITEDMTDLELVKAICRFPAGYEYSASYSSGRSMIINGGGDCWASTSAILMLSKKLGIKAWTRNGNRDPGAGSGHVNAMVELNDKYYELEAGYAMSKDADGYRPYTVTERMSLFSYYYSTDGATIYQYDGYEKTGKLEVPEMVGGNEVIGIGEGAFSDNEFTEITLPDTLVSIADFAFSSSVKLTNIEIPASVTSIGIGIFSGANELETITIEENNKNYKSVDNAIYSKNGKTLVTCPSAAALTILDTVNKIEDYAFYYNANLTKIRIPSNVTVLGEAAFANCSNLALVSIEGEGLQTIGNHCFRSDYMLSTMRLPASITELGAYAFAYCSQMKHIYFEGDAPVFGGEIEGTFYDGVFVYCTAKAYYPEGNNTWTSEVLTGHEGEITWDSWMAGEVISLENAVITLEKTEYTYNKEYHEPEAKVSLEGVSLTENSDYVVSYSDNCKVGTATVTIVGIGNYEGEIATTFTIKKAQLEGYAYANQKTIVEKDTAEITYVNGEGGHTYSSSNEKVATVDDQGVITGVSAGEAVITVHIPESENYYATTATITIKVTHDSQREIVDAAVVNGTIQVRCPRCNAIYAATVPTDISVYWGKAGTGAYVSPIDEEQQVGTRLKCLVYGISNVDLNEIEIISNNTDVAVVDGKIVEFIRKGTVTITVLPKYNPAIAQTYTFKILEENEKSEESNEEEEKTTTTNKKVTYYSTKSGMHFMLTTTGKRTATLISVDKNKVKSKVTVPSKVKWNGKNYVVTAIGKNAFAGCKKLTSITVKSKQVKTIGKNAFKGCKKLKKITLKTTKLTKKSVGKNAFKGTHKKLVIKVPKKYVKKYKTYFKNKGNKKVRVVR